MDVFCCTGGVCDGSAASAGFATGAAGADVAADDGGFIEHLPSKMTPSDMLTRGAMMSPITRPFSVISMRSCANRPRVG